MTMTNSESQWLARAMRAISYVAVDMPEQKGAGEDVLCAKRSFVEVSRRRLDEHLRRCASDARRSENDRPQRD
jgi:hypothetical protein